MAAPLQPYAKRAITVTFKLGTGPFGDTGSDTVTLQGLRVLFQADWSNLDSQPTAIIRIYGMTLSQMNQLTTAGNVYTVRGDKVQVDAGDVGGNMIPVFVGTINQAFPDFREAPNAAFMVAAIGGGELNIKPAQPVTFSGSRPFATVMQKILEPTGLTHEDNGVNAILQSPYFPGSTMSQVSRALQSARCFGCLDTMKNVVATWPKNSSRGGDAAVVSPATGMIGYPEFQRAQIMVRTRFDGTLHPPGTKIQVQSQLDAAKGNWTVLKEDLTLSSEEPGGPWEMLITASNPQA
jgi:hypothetical protein